MVFLIKMKNEENIKGAGSRKVRYYITAYIGTGTEEDTIKVHYDYNGRGQNCLS